MVCSFAKVNSKSTRLFASKIFYFSPNFTFNIRKSHNISDGKTLYFRSNQPKTSWGWKTPPQVPSGLKVNESKNKQHNGPGVLRHTTPYNCEKD